MPDQDRPTTLAEGKYVRLVKQGMWEWATRKNATGMMASHWIFTKTAM